METSRLKRVAYVIAFSLLGSCPLARAGVPATREYPMINGNPIDPKTYQGYVDEGFLPLRGEMSDVELAQKFDLDLPQMADVKAALAKGDAKALERALADYLNAKLPPVTIKPTGKLTSEQKEAAERWLRSEMAY